MGIESDMRKALAEVQAFPLRMTDNARKINNQFGISAQGQGQRNAPVGVTGRLRAQTLFVQNVTPNGIESEFGFGVPYGKYVHGVLKGGRWYMPKRHFVTFKTAPGLRRWAAQHGIDVSKRNGMYVGGGKPNPFLYKAVENVLPAWQNAIWKLKAGG
jgi:hypothetical protein